MPSFDAEGTLVKIFDTRVISDRFQVREFVVSTEEDSPYPQELVFQFTNQDCDRLDSFKEGEKVQVSTWVRGRKWQKTPADEPRWFNSLVARKLESLTQAENDELNQDTYSDDIPMPSEESGGGASSNDDDDYLPF